jgi:hypothetical protein
MLAAVYEPDPDDDRLLETWVHNHYQDHLEIQQAIQKQGGGNLEILEINHINPDAADEWLERHQLMHNEMNAVLRQQGNDLTQVDFNNREQRTGWFWLNFREHFNARGVLKI